LEGLHANAKIASAEAADQEKSDAESDNEMAVHISGLENKMRNKKKAAHQPDAEECSNCETVGAKLKCSNCRVSRYCNKACQLQHWKDGHKEMCVTPEKRRPQTMTSDSSWNPRGAQDDKEGDGDDECPVCLESLSDCAVCVLPCKHTLHLECIDKLRKHGVGLQCPLCRTSFCAGTGKRSFADDGVHGEKVQQLVALTRKSEAECVRMLTAEGNDIDRACNTYFNGAY